jgi:hypothetical protein
MDEFDQGGIDPQVKRYFRKISSSFYYGMLWMLAMSMLGLYFQLGFVANGFRWYNIVFYLVFLFTLFLLVRFFYRTWKEG